MIKKPRVLIVEDEKRMRELIADYLIEEDLEVIEASHGNEAIELARRYPPNLVVLDIMMPGIDGFEVCKRLRKESNAIIVMLTAKSEEEDKLYGYELGADDYITKPFSPKVLTAKIKALLTRWNFQEDAEANTELIDFVIDEQAHEVRIHGELLELSPKEYDLLLFFTNHRNIVLTRDILLDRVWGMDYYGDLRTVDTHVKRLRKKLGDKASCIHTVRGNGYKFKDK